MKIVLAILLLLNLLAKQEKPIKSDHNPRIQYLDASIKTKLLSLSNLALFLAKKCTPFKSYKYNNKNTIFNLNLHLMSMQA